MTLDLRNTQQAKIAYLDAKIREATYSIFREKKEYSVITSSLDLDKLKVQLSTDTDFVRYKIRDLIRYVSNDYELVIIDTPPSTELLTSTAIGASDYIIIPIQLEPNSVQGAVNIIEGVIPGVKTYLNPDVQLLGIVVNMHQSAETQNQIEAELREYLNDKVFETKISRSVRVGELSALGRSAPKPTKKSEKALGELQALTVEIYRRLIEQENILTQQNKKVEQV
jgi:chromosome partitioning protein